MIPQRKSEAMEGEIIEPDSDLDRAAEELFSAWRKYRDFVKRNYRDRLAGMMWVRKGNEVICYSESARYSGQVTGLLYDKDRDYFYQYDLPGQGGNGNDSTSVDKE